MNLAEKITAWAEREASVKAVVLFGSRVRATDDDAWRADAHSDWDFQIVSSRPAMFADAAWTKSLGLEPRTYVVRRAAIGGVPKIAALFATAEADFVILPTARFGALRRSVERGLHRDSARLRRALQDLAVVVRPGWRFLKGAETWEPFYRTVVADIGDPRLADAEVRALADGLVCDAVWTLRKIDRGEFLAAQRMLHRALAETNFRLLHELKLRRGERTFPEARRIELVGAPDEVAAIAIDAAPNAAALRAAVEKSSATCRAFVDALLGGAWRWPE